MTIYIGIDPGFKGAVGIIESDGSVRIVDTPSGIIGKSKREYFIPKMVEILAPYVVDAYVAIEKVHAMPRQGVASAFTFGKGFGLWLGILGSLAIPYDEVTPQRWQGVMLDGMQKGKDSSRMRAMALWPQFTDRLNRKSNDGRAEALLIAEWRKRQG